jgi:hypothetical protein
MCVTNGTIFQISALEGYEGTLLGQIRVGMTAQEALALPPHLYYPDFADSTLILNFFGLESWISGS